MARKAITNSEQLFESTSVTDTIVPSNTVVVCFNSPYSIEFIIRENSGLDKKVTINGNATHLKGKDKGVLPLAGAHGLTFGVLKEDWEQIKHLYGTMGIFRNGLIWAEETSARAADSVKEKKNVANGFEPIDTAKQASTEPVASDN